MKQLKMNYGKITIFFFCLFILFFDSRAQQVQEYLKIGFSAGVGTEFNNRNYTYTSQNIKLQFIKTVLNTNRFSYDFLVQPEFSLGTHQLLNLYFVKPDEDNYLEKRELYTKRKVCKEYIVNIGMLMRYSFSKKASMYALGSVGPMYIDTETERLSKGFAFADVFALGFNYQVGKLILDVRPNVRHMSNAGLQPNNAGFNTKNIEFGQFIFQVKALKQFLNSVYVMFL